MRTRLIYSVLFTCFSLFVFYGCSKDSSNPTAPSNFSAKGAEYLPLTSGKILNAKVSITSTDYDSLGNVTNYNQINNQIYSGSIGAATLIRNVTANPIYYYDKKHNLSKLAGYLTNNSDEIIALAISQNSPNFTILPTEIKIGTEWIVDPQSSPRNQVKVKLTEVLENYTNSAGISFQNVIKLNITYKDSTGETNQWSDEYWMRYQKEVLNANIYLSKGIGIVGIKLNNFEKIIKEVYISKSYSYNYYYRSETNGELGITN